MENVSRRDFIKKVTLGTAGMLPAMDALAQLIGTSADDTNNIIDFSCRLTDWRSLLHLDYYFINVRIEPDCVVAKYTQEEAYMIVRLPQQHIAEKYMELSTPSVPDDCITCKFSDDDAPPEIWVAETRIAGYSYLAFRILFRNEKDVIVRLNEHDLLDWNNEEKFRLVVRQNINESLFKITIRSGTANYFENTYPLGYEPVSEGVYVYNPNYIPKVYSDPITAIEAPWRLIISPKLPNQDKYKFSWEFSDALSSELWMATLTIEPRLESIDSKQLLSVGDEKKQDQGDDEIFRKLDLMMIGSPDHVEHPIDEADFLPSGVNRKNLVDLYIRYKLLARADKLAFSSLGISTFIEFKNKLFQDLKISGSEIDLYSYKHLISFGRDEEVEVTRVLLEKETGLKMLLVQTTKRRTKKGISYLDYREYIMPLEIEKDYQNHIDEVDVSKFNAPFKKIRFLETDPKRICPLENLLYRAPGNEFGNIRLIDGQWEGIFYPRVPNLPCGTKNLYFSMEITDWHDKRHTIQKAIQAITIGINKRIDPDLANVNNILKLEEIDSFFSSDITKYEAAWNSINTQFRKVINDLKADEIGKKEIPSRDLIVEQVNDLKDACLKGIDGVAEKLISHLQAFDITFLKNAERIQAILNTAEKDFAVFINTDLLTAAINELSTAAKDVSRLPAEKLAEARGRFQQLQVSIGLSVDALGERIEILKRAGLRKDLYDAAQLILTRLRRTPDKVQRMKDRLVIDLADTIVYFEGGAINAYNELIRNFDDEDRRLTTLAKDIIKDRKLSSEQAAELESMIGRINVHAQGAKKLVESLLGEYNELLIKVEGLRARMNDLKDDIKRLRAEADQARAVVQNKFYDAVKDFKTKCEQIAEQIEGLKILILSKVQPGMSIPLFLESTDLGTSYRKLRADLTTILAGFKDYEKFFGSRLEVIMSEINIDLTKANFGSMFLFEEVPEVLVNLRREVKVLVDAIDEGIKDKALEIRNVIQTYRSKLGYAVNKVEDEIDDFINDELSVLETDFIVLQGAMKTFIKNEKVVLDFFHQYASIPQLNHAQVFIPSVCKMVKEDFSVGVKFAKDYFQNQVDLVKLNVEKNKSRVFAEIKESSKHVIQGKIRNISAELGGVINPELPTGFLTYLRDKKEVALELIQDLDVRNNIKGAREAVNNAKAELEQAKAALDRATAEAKAELEKRLNEKLGTYKDAMKRAANDVVLLGTEAKEQWNAIQSFDPQTFFKDLEAKVLGCIPLKDILKFDFDVPRLSPSKDEITYSFVTKKLKSKDFNLFRFGTNDGTQIQVFMRKKLTSKEYLSFVKLNNFNVAVRISGEDVLLIKFKEFEIKSTDTKPKSVSVKIDSVAFGGPLDFFASLAEKVKMPGSGLRIVPSFSQLEVGYSFPIPGISSPAFNFTNIKFDVALKLTFANSSAVKPLLMEVGINRVNDKFLISAGIFGGRGHFTLSASPERIEKIDAAIEYGGYIGINLGIASGYVFLFAGMRMIFESSGDLTFIGYVICEGGVTVFGFISIYLTVELAMTYRRIGGQAALYGSASLQYSIKIGFFKKSFGISFSKTIFGAQGKSIEQAESQASITPRVENMYADASGGLYDEFEIIDDELPDDTESSKVDREKDEARLFKNVFSSDEWKAYCKCFRPNC